MWKRKKRGKKLSATFQTHLLDNEYKWSCFTIFHVLLHANPRRLKALFIKKPQKLYVQWRTSKEICPHLHPTLWRRTVSSWSHKTSHIPASFTWSSEARFHRCLPASHSVIPVLVKLLPPCFFPLQGFITDQWKASYFRVNKVKCEKLVLICPFM